VAPAPTSAPPGLRSPAVIFIIITLFIDILGIGIIIPVAPKLVQQLQGGSEDASSIHVGMLASLYAVMQFIFAPILGSLSDTFGRRPVVLFSLLGSAIDFLACAFAPTLLILYITRAINGITGANFAAATAYIADVSPPEKRAGNFGLIGAAFGIGFIIGPLLGGVLGEISLRLPFYAAAGLCAINFIYGCFVLPESLKPENRRPFSADRASPLTAFKTLAAYPFVRGWSISSFLIFTAEYSLRATWVLYTGHRYHWTPRQVGYSLAIVGVCAAVVQGGLARHLVPKLGETRSVILGFSMVVLGYLGYGFATEGWHIYVIIAVTSIGGIGGPAAQALVSRSVAANEQGTIQGALTSVQSLAQILGPLLGTSLFAYFVSAAAPYQIPGISFFVGAVLAMIALLNAVRILKRFPIQSQPAT
jgi:DHA1 family tetracycline resistance protein-like MFS transporter